MVDAVTILVEKTAIFHSLLGFVFWLLLQGNHKGGVLVKKFFCYLQKLHLAGQNALIPFRFQPIQWELIASCVRANAYCRRCIVKPIRDTK